jgi:hypothetical protein
MPEPSDPGWMPYAFGALQTIIAAVLAYISKLLRDIRGEITTVKIEVTKHDVMIEEGEKRAALTAHDINRRLDTLERINRNYSERA